MVLVSLTLSSRLMSLPPGKARLRRRMRAALGAVGLPLLMWFRRPGHPGGKFLQFGGPRTCGPVRPVGVLAFRATARKGWFPCGDDKTRSARVVADRRGRRLVRVPRRDEGPVGGSLQGGRAVGVGEAQPAPARDSHEATKAAPGESGVALSRGRTRGTLRSPVLMAAELGPTLLPSRAATRTCRTRSCGSARCRRPRRSSGRCDWPRSSDRPARRCTPLGR